jgi:hypothetical protein
MKYAINVVFSVSVLVYIIYSAVSPCTTGQEG